METTVDDRGRILIPKELRERFHLTPGSRVIVEAGDGDVRIKHQLTRKEALDRLAGLMERRSDADPMDPLDLKKIWEPKL